LELPHTDFLQARKRFLKKATEFYLKDKRNGTQLPLLVVQNAKKKLTILTQAHENLGHKGEQVVYELRFFWPHMRIDIHHHIASCHECQICMLKRMEVPVTIPVTLFEKVYIDIMYMPLSAQYRYIVAAKDDLTGVTEASPLRKNNSKNLTKFFWEKIYCWCGVVGQVTTDNGPEVKGAFEDLVGRMGIPQVTIGPCNKPANRVVERDHFCKGNYQEP
jgi:hypothetical protein